MSRFYGKIGFLKTVEKTEVVDGEEMGTGVWIEELTERPYYGDVNKYTHRVSSGSGLNDDIDISNEISIVADSYANENFAYMKYANWAGVNWAIQSINVQYPRLILTIGGLYNRDTSGTTEETD